MKRFLSTLSTLIFCALFALCGCIQSSYTDSDTMKEDFLSHQDLFLEAANEAFTLGDSIFISTYEFFCPEGSDAEATGLYVNDIKTGKTTSISSTAVTQLMETCKVNSLAVNCDDATRVCEFSIGGGGQYYNGVYYAEPDGPVFLNNLSIPLVEDGDGYSYSVENMNYYTEKWADGFYYYVAKTK